MNGDVAYTRSWIQNAGGCPSCNKCGICFGGDYYVETGYFDRPCQNFNTDLTYSEKMKIPIDQRVLCNGQWGVWPVEDVYKKYIDKENGEKCSMSVTCFDAQGKIIRTFQTPHGFSIKKYLDAQLGGFQHTIVCNEPVLVVNVCSKENAKLHFTFVGFYQSKYFFRDVK